MEKTGLTEDKNESTAPIQTFLSQAAHWLSRLWLALRGVRIRIAWLTFVEAALIIGWAFWVGRGYLNFSLTTLPSGGESSLVTETHFIWTQLFKCGPCIMWNGSLNGGAPAFAETMGSVLHPLTILTTLFLGVINGTKVLIILGLAMAGIAQWWLARVMKLGWVARMWCGFMAVVGGHLMSKMDNGAVPLLFSVASASLIVAPAVELYLTRKRRSIVLLGLMLAFTWLSGSGYTQVGVALSVLPVFIVFMLDGQFRLKPVWKDFALAGLLSLLFVGVWLIPLLHFWPNFIKEGDPYLNGFPSLAYNPLNLVISDFNFYQSQALGFTPNNYHYYIFIGWVPVLLALLSLRLAPKDKNRLLAFFFLSIGLIFLVCSSQFIKAVQTVLPEVSYLRYLYITSGLSVVYVLGLAAWGLDGLLKLKFPRVGFFLSSTQPRSFSMAWLLVGIPIILAIKPGYDMASSFLSNQPFNVPPDVIAAVQTPSAEWINAPLSEYIWLPVLLERGVKLTGVFRPWRWNERDEPGAYLQIVRDSNNTVTDNIFKAFPGTPYSDLKVLSNFSNEYAYIQNGNKITPCSADSMGGNIDVTCTSDQGGTLIVHENNWSGWTAAVDGKSAGLDISNWLAVSAPAGAHVYTFRYRPWDVPLGILVTLSGIGLSVWILRRKEEEPAVE